MSNATALPVSTSVHMCKQTIISIIISMAFSAAFFLLIFRDAGSVEVWAPDYLALDFLPQSGFASLMAALMPALQTHAAMARGELPGQAPTIKSVVLRALLLALLGLGLAGVVIAILQISGIAVFAWGTAFAIKVIYGGVLGIIITPWAVGAVLNSKRQ